MMNLRISATVIAVGLVTIFGLRLMNQPNEIVQDKINQSAQADPVDFTAQRFHIDYVGQGTFSQGSQSQKVDHPVLTKMTGMITFEEMYRVDDRVVSKVIISDLSHIEATIGGQDISQTVSLEADLLKPFFVEKTRRGKVVNFYTEHQISKVASGIFTEILSLAQLSWSPKGHKVPSWLVYEEDINGRYRTRYRLADHKGDGSVHVTKSKLGYVPQEAAAPIEMPNMTTEGHLDYVYDVNRSLVVSVKGEYLTTFQVEKQVVGRAKNAISMVFVDKVKGAKSHHLSPEALKKNFRLGSLQDALASMSSEEKIQKNVLKDTTFDDLLGALDSIDERTKQQDFKENTTVLNKLYAFVYLNPDRLGEVLDEIQVADVDSRKFLYLVGALGHVGSAESQKALVTLLDSFDDQPKKLSVVIPTLGLVSAPTIDSEQAILKIAEDHLKPSVRDSATLAMGSMARSLKGLQHARARGLVKAINDAHAHKKSTDDINLYLMALSNTGMPAAFKAADRFSKSENHHVRSSAVLAAKSRVTKKSSQLLIKLLSEDQQEDVRLRAAMALQDFGQLPGVTNAQMLRYDEEASLRVRTQMLRNLWRHRDGNPHIINFVVSQVKKEQSPEGRRFAANLVRAFVKGL